MGEQWEKVDGFNNVSSISVRVSKGARAIVVAESGVVLWEQGKRSRYQANARIYEGHNKKWSVGSMPDFDDGAEIELCGVLPSGEYVRVDNTLFREDHHSLARMFLCPVGPLANSYRIREHTDLLKAG